MSSYDTGSGLHFSPAYLKLAISLMVPCSDISDYPMNTVIQGYSYCVCVRKWIMICFTRTTKLSESRDYGASALWFQPVDIFGVLLEILVNV